MLRPILASLLLLLSSQATLAASFSCARARAPDEKAICADPGLSNLDSRLAGLIELDEGTVAMGQRGDLQNARAAWLKTRAQCGADCACLHRRYEARLAEVIGHLTERLCGEDGPPC